MKGDKSTIQTTRTAHEEVRDKAWAAVAEMMRLSSGRVLSADYETGLSDGFSEGWDYCLAAILRDGNCKFEKGD